jgi:CheY-like chemotaxis protein
MRRILVVDDDRHVGQAIRVWLQHHGFRVSTADGGPSGLAALDSGPFDLMIVDVFMPQMRGFESIRLFHERDHGHVFRGRAAGPRRRQVVMGGSAVFPAALRRHAPRLE